MHNYVNLAIAVDLDFEGLLAPVIHDADDQAAPGHRPRHPRPGRPGPHQEALGRRHHRRHLHHLQLGPVRHAWCSPDHQPAPGGHPVHRRRAPEAGRGHRRRRQRGHRHPLGRASWPWLGPPGLRRCLRRRLPGPQVKEILETRDWEAELCSDPAPCAGWAGCPTRDAHALQHGLFAAPPDDHLLLLEHPHVYTLGVRADPSTTCWSTPTTVGADLVRADRGGDVTYHGPGQLVGYPILTVPGKRGGGMADTVAYVRSVEQVLIDALADLGPGRRGPGRGPGPGCGWRRTAPRPRKIAAIGVRLSRGRSMHGFALNVDPDLA